MAAHKNNSYASVNKKHTTQYILSLIPSMIDHANRPYSLNFNALIADNNRNQDIIHQFAHANPDFKHAVLRCKLKIGSRRDELAMHNKIDGSMVRYGQHNYDPEHYATMLELKRAGREETTVNPPVINVHLSGRTGKIKKPKSK